MHKMPSPLPSIIKYWLFTNYITMQCYMGNQRELLYNVPTMIATEHYNTCSNLTVEECSIFIRNTMLRTSSMSNDLRILY